MEHMKGERMWYIFLFWNFDHKISRSEAPTVGLGMTSLEAKAGQAKAASKATAKPKGGPGNLEETMAPDMLDQQSGAGTMFLPK